MLLLTLLGCDENEAVCGEVAGREIEVELLAFGGGESEYLGSILVFADEEELAAFWRTASVDTFDDDTAVVDEPPPLWIDGTQMVWVGWEVAPEGPQRRVLKFFDVGGRLVIEQLVTPYCQTIPESYCCNAGQLYRTPIATDPVVCELETACIDHAY